MCVCHLEVKAVVDGPDRIVKFQFSSWHIGEAALNPAPEGMVRGARFARVKRPRDSETALDIPSMHIRTYQRTNVFI